MTIRVGGRRTGKSLAVISWLAEGSPLPRYPSWNRIVYVSHEQRRQAFIDLLVRHFDDLYTQRHGEEMHEQLADDPTVAIPGDELRAVTLQVMTRAVKVFTGYHGLDRDIRIAVDDLDDLLVGLMGRKPDLVTWTSD